MKVAFCTRANYATLPGGDTIQLQKTKSHLEKTGKVEIEIVTDPAGLNASFDVVHIFNMATRPITEAYFQKAKALKRKVALSTIFWDYRYQATKDWASLINYEIFKVPGTIPLFLKLDALSSALIQKPRIIAGPFRKFVAACLTNADLLLPNSVEEIQQAAVFAGLPVAEILTKTKVVVNATEVEDVEDLPGFHDRYNLPTNYILQAGRIEYIKNQLGLLEAFKADNHLPIVFLGRPNGNKYYRCVERKAATRGNVFFISQVPHSDMQQFYRHAAVHVLPSLRESPGLVSLEALQNRCPIVTSDSRFLPAETYFKNIATLVNPLSPQSIREGVLNELSLKRNMADISRHVSQTFSWQQAAAQTLEGYHQII